MTNRRTLIKALSGIFGLLLLGDLAFGDELSSITKVDSNKVCMVNNRLFPNDQIPVKVGGKMYYGCCANCKKTLTEKREARVAIDPISKQEVDKAEAVIGALEDGQVIYFENEENLKAFAPKAL